jgi:hypothetical protein
MLKKFDLADQPNLTILADPGPRGKDHIKQFAGMPLSWIPTTCVYKGGDLRYALNYGEVRFPVLQQFLEDSHSEWSQRRAKDRVAFFRMFETSLAPSISHDKPPAILSLIGDTPLVEITQLDTGPVPALPEIGKSKSGRVD